MKIQAHLATGTRLPPTELDRMYNPRRADMAKDEYQPTPKKVSQQSKGYVHAWDMPGIFTYSWIKSTAASIQSRGDYNGPFGRAIGGLMILASPIAIPISLIADIVNTAIFPGKLLYRSL